MYTAMLKAPLHVTGALADVFGLVMIHTIGICEKTT